jgi:hypothetical protein
MARTNRTNITRDTTRDTTRRRLDLKALRLATHGWLLGNPLVYKPGAADIDGIARELARAGSATGTLILGETGGVDAGLAQMILILRLAMPQLALGEAAAEAIAEMTRDTFGCSCGIEGQWDVVLGDESTSRVVAHVSLSKEDEVVFLGLRFAFDTLQDAGCDDSGQPLTPLLARPDWREVFLARALHGLDIRLR